MPPAPLNVTSTEGRLRVDKRILLIFAVFAALSFALPVGAAPFVKGVTISDVASRILSGLSLSCLLAGISSYLHYRKAGLTPRKRFLAFVALVAFVISLIVTAITIVVILAIPGSIVMPDLGGTPLEDQLLVVFAFLMITLVPSMFLSILLFMIAAFGIVGIMAAITRRIAPRILKAIVASANKQRLSLEERALRWLFAIPDTLDTRTLRVSRPAPRSSLTRLGTLPIVGWQLFLGAILAVYVSLNPFLSNRSSEALLSIFTTLMSASLLVPFLVLPWFAFRRIDARISGQVKDFTLFNGLRSRIFQSYIALGTILILIRLSISEIAAATYILLFASFMGILLSVALMCTYIFLNNFEDGLAEDIYAAFAKGKEGQVDSTLAGETQQSR